MGESKNSGHCSLWDTRQCQSVNQKVCEIVLRRSDGSKEYDPHVDEDCSGCNESLSPLVGPYGSVGPGVAGFFFMVREGIHSMGLGNHYVGDGTHPDLE